MLFGGQLASILVCEKCKKVSVTHEDFNDLSLSIKPEDYVKERAVEGQRWRNPLWRHPDGSVAEW